MKTISILEKRFIQHHKKLLQNVDLYNTKKLECYKNNIIHYIELKVEIIEILAQVRQTSFDYENKRLNKKFSIK